MAKTTAKQVLYNIANDYKTKTGDPTEINYGNVEGKIDTLVVAPSGTINIPENGTYNVANYASAVVNTPAAGSGTIPFSNIFDCIESTTEVTINA